MINPPNGGISTEWACPTCGRTASLEAFCAHCGERRLTERDGTLRGLASQWFESVVQVDGRIYRSVRTLLLTPGQLTAAYCEGRRKRFIGPFQLFVAVSVIFFVSQSVTGLNILSVPLKTHLYGSYYRDSANAMVNARLARTREPLTSFAAAFDQQEQTVAKSAVLIMLPPLALAVGLLFRRREHRAPVHVVFGLHFLSFMLVFLTLLFPILAVLLRLAAALGLHPEWSLADEVISLLELAAVVVYFWSSVGRVYGVRGLDQLIPTVALTALVPVLLYGYRIAIFWLTLQSM